MMKSIFLIATFLISNAYAVEGAPQIANDYSICDNSSCSVDIVNKYHIQPSIFGGRIVYAEPVYASKESESDGLLFEPVGFLNSYNTKDGSTLSKGIDYKVFGKKISFPNGGAVISAPIGFTKPKADDKRFNFRLKEDYNQYQIPITYSKFQNLPLHTSGSLNKLRNFVDKSKELKVTFFGDSITYVGDYLKNKDGNLQPPYAYLVTSYMGMVKGRGFKWFNPSVKGWNTNNAVASINDRLLKQDSDVYIIAFGMNDAVDINPEKYASNMEKIINAIKLKNPKAYILLISSTLPNPKWSLPHQEYYKEYGISLSKLSVKYKNVAYLDVTSTWQDMLKRKSYWSITLNGLNHPSDFGHRVIAEAVLTTLLGKDFI
ncbi:SGNH/GDSL hydrolase family protein [Ewingella sp. S1.OA.A_B6]